MRLLLMFDFDVDAKIIFCVPTVVVPLFSSGFEQLKLLRPSSVKTTLSS